MMSLNQERFSIYSLIHNINKVSDIIIKNSKEFRVDLNKKKVLQIRIISKKSILNSNCTKKIRIISKIVNSNLHFFNKDKNLQNLKRLRHKRIHLVLIITPLRPIIKLWELFLEISTAIFLIQIQSTMTI